MKKSFGLTDEHVFFWVVHDEADADHSNIGVELLDKFAPTEADRRAVIAAVRTSLNMHYMLYDAVYREMQKFA